MSLSASDQKTLDFVLGGIDSDVGLTDDAKTRASIGKVWEIYNLTGQPVSDFVTKLTTKLDNLSQGGWGTSSASIAESAEWLTAAALPGATIDSVISLVPVEYLYIYGL